MTAFRLSGAFRARIALLLAVTYLGFQFELDPEEYLEQHRPPAERPTWSTPSVTWETFDKTNAPEAFTVEPCLPIVPVSPVIICDDLLDPFAPPAHPVRDKSPPSPNA